MSTKVVDLQAWRDSVSRRLSIVEVSASNDESVTQEVLVPKRFSISILARLLSGAWKASQVMLALIWPVLRWILSFIVLWDFGQLVLSWGGAGVLPAAFAFILHFFVLVSLTMLVARVR